MPAHLDARRVCLAKRKSRMRAASNLFQRRLRNTLERASEPAQRIVASEAVLDLVDEHLEGGFITVRAFASKRGVADPWVGARVMRPIEIAFRLLSQRRRLLAATLFPSQAERRREQRLTA